MILLLGPRPQAIRLGRFAAGGHLTRSVRGYDGTCMLRLAAMRSVVRRPLGSSGSLEELDRFGLGVDAVGEEDRMDLLAAVDGDEQLGIAGRQRARFSQVHYLVADLANPQHLASNA